MNHVYFPDKQVESEVVSDIYEMGSSAMCHMDTREVTLTIGYEYNSSS